MASEERWGVWITQDKPRRGQAKPDAYWWQGPTYAGPPDLTEVEARAAAEQLQACGPTWRYEAKLYSEPAP